MSEKTARCLGWLQGFSSTVWALVSTNDGAKLVDSSAADEYDKVVKELADELVKENITVPKIVPVTLPVTYERPTKSWSTPPVTCKNDGSITLGEESE